MTDTRQALAALLDAVDPSNYTPYRERERAYQSARAALAAQPVAGEVAHPVAWLCSISHPDWLEVCERDAPGAFPVYATPQAQAAPEPEPWPFEHGTDEAGTLNIKPSAPEPSARAVADHVEQRIRTWRQRMMNKSGDCLALDDFMSNESIEDFIDFVCDEWAMPLAASPKPSDEAECERATIRHMIDASKTKE